jgi:hypothetical protein
LDKHKGCPRRGRQVEKWSGKNDLAMGRMKSINR